MKTAVEIKSIPYIQRISDGRIFPLAERLSTIGTSADCQIILSGNRVPDHLGHILFAEGSYTLTIINRNIPALRNGSQIMSQTILSDKDNLTFGDEIFLFKNNLPDILNDRESEISPLRRFISALTSFMRTGNSDIRFELLSGIAQLLRADGARLVVEDHNSKFVTIARYPQTSGLDRFSERAILWAKEKSTTILMHDSDWKEYVRSKGSLEINSIGSILCRPLFEGLNIRGYLYLDKKRENTVFTNQEREILDDVGPVFDDLLAFYDQSNRQRETIERLQKSLETQEVPVIYACETMQKAIELSIRFASIDSTILVTGETGTGKELFAKFIHRHSRRSEKNFSAINCGALPENLIESELFGHEKGAFTGAYQKKQGLFECASGGTIFLDEVGEMPLNLQVKLLRVLQESEITPVGSTETLRVNVRIIAATNRDLREEVRNGRFREDLLYRLNVLQIEVPPLRKRNRDVLLLSDYFIKKYSLRFGMQEKGLTLQAQAKLLMYSWPGNVRQLENIIQKSLLMSKSNLIADSDIDIEANDKKENIRAGSSGQTLKEIRSAAEIEGIREALKKASGNISMAARILDIDRKWLSKLMKEYDVTVLR